MSAEPREEGEELGVGGYRADLEQEVWVLWGRQPRLKQVGIARRVDDPRVALDDDSATPDLESQASYGMFHAE